jgi:hypothetical protein
MTASPAVDFPPSTFGATLEERRAELLVKHDEPIKHAVGPHDGRNAAGD